MNLRDLNTSSFQKGNFVQYSSDGYQQKGLIISLPNQDKRYPFWGIQKLRHLSKDASTDYVLEGDIYPIYIEAHHLLDLGFTNFNPPLKSPINRDSGENIVAFAKDGIKLIQVIHLLHRKNSSSEFIDIEIKNISKFHLIDNENFWNLPIQEILDSTTTIDSINSLQNFWMKHFGHDLDITPITKC